MLTALNYIQIVLIGLAHRLYTDVQYFFGRTDFLSFGNSDISSFCRAGSRSKCPCQQSSRVNYFNRCNFFLFQQFTYDNIHQIYDDDNHHHHDNVNKLQATQSSKHKDDSQTKARPDDAGQDDAEANDAEANDAGQDDAGQDEAREDESGQKET